MAEVRVLPASLKHAQCLAERLSEADRREVALSSGADPLQALTAGVEASRIRTALVQSGKCLAIWGFIQNGDTGIPWMLSAEPEEYTFKAKRKLIEGSRRDVARALKKWPQLENRMLASNQHHLRLLETLGFEFGRIDGLFMDFSMRRQHV